MKIQRVNRRLPYVIGALLAGSAILANAQDSVRKVRQLSDQLFDGMRAGDSTAVAAPRDKVWDERIWDIRINVDGRLTPAWMEYAFYLGDQLHHCGVNSMQLYRSDGGWGITYLADTDRGFDCNGP